MGFKDWFKSKKSDVNVQDDDDLDDELMEELGLTEPDLRSQMMYAFVHVALREAVMLNHPELIKQLDELKEKKPFMPLLHFWSKASMILVSHSVIDDMDELDDDDWMPFDEMDIEQFSSKGYRISVVTFPEPRFSPEAYMVAIVHQEGVPQDYHLERGSARYFTLEYTGQDMAPMLCEWDDEEHRNYGDGPQPETKAFVQVVEEYL